jgi:hypothetical protein
MIEAKSKVGTGRRLKYGAAGAVSRDRKYRTVQVQLPGSYRVQSKEYRVKSTEYRVQPERTSQKHVMPRVACRAGAGQGSIKPSL